MTKRIWELDALRGICILGMVVIHLLYDLNIPLPSPLVFLQNWGGCAFLLLSGVCVTLGHHPIRRGLVVLGCGMLCTLVTWGMYILGLADRGTVIWFGVLHCLGVCMLLWPGFKRLFVPILIGLAVVFLALGFYFQSLFLPFPWLAPLGLCSPDFSSADYFPLFPNLGFFLLGAVIGKTLYAKKQSLFSAAPKRCFLCFLGRHSLIIYLLHQPLLYGVLWLIFLF